MIFNKLVYKKRVIDAIIQEKLSTYGALLIEGPKWVGKTWTAYFHSKSSFFVGDPSKNFQNRDFASIDPLFVLNGEQPRLIDEWQEVPSLWDAVRFQVDQTPKKGQYILTGSVIPPQYGVLHSGTGRIDRILMRTMSSYEAGDGDGLLSLNDLFTQSMKPTRIQSTEIHHLLYLICRGGWPASIGLSDLQAFDLPKSYLKSLILSDVIGSKGLKKSRTKIDMLMKSLARNIATPVKLTTLIRDIQESDDELIDQKTVTSYIKKLSNLFIVDQQLSFAANLRSSLRIAKLPKRHFIDPSLAVAALNLSPQKLLKDLPLLGLLFESLVTRDLKIYADTFGGQIFYYRNFDTDLEVDAIVEHRDGNWGAIEIKLGTNQIEEAARKLVKFKESMIANQSKSMPSFLAIITGLGDYAYQRTDGVLVIPFLALKP
jgi:uncharacterized protein